MRRLVRTVSGDCVKSDAMITKGLITGALWTPAIIHNLVSVKKLTEVGLKIVLDKETGFIIKNNNVVAQAHARNEVYVLDVVNLKKLLIVPVGILLSTSVVELPRRESLSSGGKELLKIHRQLGHKTMKTIKAAIKASKIIVENRGMRLKILHTQVPQCEVCLICKPRSKPVNCQVTEYVGRPFERIGMDVKGPFTPSVPGGYTKSSFSLTMLPPTYRSSSLMLQPTWPRQCRLWLLKYSVMDMSGGS